MGQVSFCCADAYGYLFDQRVAEVSHLLEARDYARELVWSVIKTEGLEDWRSCRLHVRDQTGREIFLMPFTWALGKRQRFVSFWQRSEAFPA